MLVGLTFSFGTVSAQVTGRRILVDGVYYDWLTDGNVAVAKLYSVQNVYIRDSLSGLGTVTRVGPRAAAFLSLTETVQLPRGITYIGDSAFAFCSSLRTLKVNSLIPPTLGVNVFSHTDIKNCTLIVPRGSLEAYKEADTWGQFGTIVDTSGEKAARKGRKNK